MWRCGCRTISRAIFAEGAFNAAFVPAYARIREQGGAERAGLFADRIFTLLLASQVVLLAVALLFTPAVIEVLAPGLVNDPSRYGLAVDLTRITFPYLLLITLVTLYGGILNALQRFAAAAAAPILLNIALVMALMLAAFFPTAGHAAAWGVLLAGVLEFLLVAGAAKRSGALPVFRWPQLDTDVRQFFRALGPAIPSARPACNWLCLPIRLSQVSFRLARYPRFIMPTVSINFPLA